MSSLPHVDETIRALQALARAQPRLSALGGALGSRLSNGARLLVAGNGGSAAQAQHLTAELVGRYRVERAPLSAIALHAETSSLTAIGNDYGFHEVFSRQVAAHGRPGDVFLGLSTSGTSENLLRAAEAARHGALRTIAFTGPRPNALADVVDEAITVDSDVAAVVQEVHLVIIHLLCEAIDELLAAHPSGRVGAPSMPPNDKAPFVGAAR